MSLRCPVIAVGALLVVSAQTTAEAQIKVGVTIATSGPAASVGQPMLKSIPALPKQMHGLVVTYSVLDDESDPKQGRNECT